MLVLGIDQKESLVAEPVLVVVDTVDHFRRLEQEIPEVRRLLIDQRCLPAAAALPSTLAREHPPLIGRSPGSRWHSPLFVGYPEDPKLFGAFTADNL